MALKLRAVYENGLLRLLDPVTLREGEEVNIQVTKIPTKSEEDKRIQAVLGDALLWNNPDSDVDGEIEPLQMELDQTMQHTDKPTSQLIIEEREQGN